MFAPLPPLGSAPSILFVTATRIGDAVLSTGLLDDLITRYPDARLTIAAGPVAAPLFAGVPGLERLIIVKKRRFSRHWLALYRQIVWRRWDLVIDLRGSALSWCLVTRHRRMIGKGDPDIHRVQHLARIFALSPPPSPRLWLLPRHLQAAEAAVPVGGLVLGIGPTANWRGKQWRAENFITLIQRLTAPGAAFADARIAIFAAPHERDAVAPVLAAFPADRVIDVTAEPDLLTVAAILARVTLYLGNDSGLMHMAAAMRVPTLGLFGPSNIALYAPWGTHTALVQTSLSPEALVSTPGYNYITTDTLMDSLSVAAVERAVLRLLDQTAETL